MRVLHVVKTSDGATWAARQARILARLGIEIHVVLPDPTGEAVGLWRETGAVIHVGDWSLPLAAPHQWRERAQAVRTLLASIAPDIIHSHFVTTTLMLRFALGRAHPVPRVFQVPGPLHLEHGIYRSLEIASAGSHDSWIASSRYTRGLYLQHGVAPDRVFLSYYGDDMSRFDSTSPDDLRGRFGIDPEAKIVGNINYMYPPKYYLGQTRGLKRHEDVIDALGQVCEQRSDVVGVLVGGQWGGGKSYESRLRARARRVAGARILLPGRIAQSDAARLWRSLDCAVHVPISENCGGVVEPLARATPTIASRVGGLPEVVLPGITGWLAPPSDPNTLAQTILHVLDAPDEAHRRGRLGQQLVTTMFDVERTATEVARIYEHILDAHCPPPSLFDSQSFLSRLRPE